jgi:hypothetical protein
MARRASDLVGVLGTPREPVEDRQLVATIPDKCDILAE